MSLPNTYIIGVQKAGTTAFYDWLGQHPDVFAPNEIKDIHFFSLDEYYNKGIDYLKSFYKSSNSQKIFLNAGVNYIFFPYSLERIKEISEAGKVILRDPIKRAFSAYNYFHKLGQENLSFEDALNRERNNEISDSIEKACFTYLEHGRYVKQLKSLFNIFSKEQVKILIYEEVIRDKDRYMAEVFEFLKIDTSFKCNYTTVNKTGKPIFRGINRLLLSDSSFKKLFQKIFPYKRIFSLKFRNKISKSLIEINTNKNKNIRNLNIEQYQMLRKEFESEINELSIMLDKDLENIWSF